MEYFNFNIIISVGYRAKSQLEQKNGWLNQKQMNEFFDNSSLTISELDKKPVIWNIRITTEDHSVVRQINHELSQRHAHRYTNKQRDDQHELFAEVE